MRADNSHYLVTAARHRAEATRKRALAALRRMDDNGAVISFDSVAREAHVSRSWLYGQSDLRTEIERLRDGRRPLPHRVIPDRQRASEASLRNRLDIATSRIRQLEADNKRLRDALAHALGEQRTADIVRGSDTPRNKSAALIGPR